VAAVWDPGLRAAMVAGRRAVHEEEVLDLLLGDIATRSAS
jgi:Protein of unknown function C-terminus (DUF2399)